MQPDAYGSAVELRVVGHAPGDNPSNRRKVEVGAVEWNAKLDASSTSLSELYFLRARYYDPVTGRFLGRDPIEFSQRYAYAGGNPVLRSDPTGLDWRETYLRIVCLVHLDLPDSCGASPGDDDGRPFDYANRLKELERETLRRLEYLVNNVGYLDFNATVCFGACITGGFQVSSASPFPNPYLGGGLGSPDLGISVTYGPGQQVTSGVACGTQVSVGSPAIRVAGTVQIGIAGPNAKEFAEGGVSFGIGPPGSGSLTCYYLWESPLNRLFR